MSLAGHRSVASPSVHWRPIFIHAGWRTGSTYVWSKFRECPEFTCYLEPLHEAFVDTPAAQFEQEFAAQITRTLRHPDLTRHYFSEYPFLPQGGVEKFKKRFPYQSYCLDEPDEDPELEAYVGHLLALARRLGRRPVLQFNRALLRSRWLQQRFDPVQILLVRRPLDVWHSYRSFPHRYFITVTALLAGQNREHPLLAPLGELLSVPRYVDTSFRREYEFYYRFTDAPPAPLYTLFFYFYALTFLYNVARADVLMDIDALSAGREARQALHARLRQYGIAVRFDDCRAPAAAGDHGLPPHRRREIETQVLALLRQRLGARLPVPPQVSCPHSAWLGEDFHRMLELFAAPPPTGALEEPQRIAP